MKHDRRTTKTTSAELMSQVRDAIDAQALSEAAAARTIGTTVGTLRLHLAGEHIRSDSAEKYRKWLSGRSAAPASVAAIKRPLAAIAESSPIQLPSAPPSSLRVVDIFSGCGGLSLGFDLLSGRRYFKTVLAVDNQAAPIRVFNSNHPSPNEPIGRQLDLTEFKNEAEVLAFYLHHVARVDGDAATISSLDGLSGGVFSAFKATIAGIDAAFESDLKVAREQSAFKAAYDQLDKQCLQQTSVAAFHAHLKLPRTGLRSPRLPPMLWAAERQGEPITDASPLPELLESARAEWDFQLNGLEERTSATGRGQLNSASRRIETFLAFAKSEAFDETRDAWCRWRALRIGAREAAFSDAEFGAAVEKLYQDRYQVSVLLGGPPCQGFSRIGRGKIRSLKDASVHAHGDDTAGDVRNLLYQQYLLFLSALRPNIFLFENVQGFHSTVKHGDREFLATDMLSEAIDELSEGRAHYAIASKTLDSSKYGIPQSRQRYFMAGILHSDGMASGARELAEFCLSLPVVGEVPLKAALLGLPEPTFVGPGGAGEDVLRAMPPVVRNGALAGTGSATARYLDWISQAVDPSSPPRPSVDSHTARLPRPDDAQWFSLMGPGTRWMDYRCDDSDTLGALGSLLRSLMRMSANDLAKGPLRTNKVELRALLDRLDGSLSIRLMLEQAEYELETENHLVSDAYLTKRDGNHGDWLARLDGERPCKTIVAHMGKDTYGYVHPWSARTLSVREAARVQSFPDSFSLAGEALTEAFKMIGNAVPPLLSHHLAVQVAHVMLRLAVQTGAAGDGGQAPALVAR